MSHDHHALLAIMKLTVPDEISGTAKELAAYLYAHTNGTGLVALPLADVTAALGVKPDKLRAYRVELKKLGFATSDVRGDFLEADVNLAITEDDLRAAMARNAEKRAVVARMEEEPSAPSRRAPEEERATTARFPDDEDQKSAPPRRADSEERATTARSDAADGTRARARSGISLNSQEGGKESFLADTGARATPDPRAVDLLRAAGVSPKLAAEAAAGYSLEQLARHVAVWQLDLKTRKAENAGALYYRLTHPDEWPVPPMPPWGAMRAGILQRVFKPEELNAWGLFDPLGREGMSAYEADARRLGLL